MNIGIDYHLVTRNPTSGMGIYVSEIIQTLKKIDRKDKYCVFDGADLYKGKKAGIAEKIFELAKEEFWIQASLIKETLRKKIDLFYFPNPPVTFFLSKPIILTIPDLSFVYDTSMNFLVKFYLYFIYFMSAHKAELITTFSENSRKDIIKILGVNEGKIFIITPAPPNGFKKANPREILKVRKLYGIHEDYILSVPGTFVNRKNPRDLIIAFKKLPSRIQRRHKLIFVGSNKDTNFEKFMKFVIDSGAADDVVCVGYVPLKHLTALYSGAKLFVSTSLYEGFGLPIIESMACGTPVIVFDNSSQTELVRGSGKLVKDVRGLSRTMESILGGNSIREGMIRAGFLKAGLFSWKTSADELQGLIDKIRQRDRL